jgi:hypothetical protein
LGTELDLEMNLVQLSLVVGRCDYLVVVERCGLMVASAAGVAGVAAEVACLDCAVAFSKAQAVVAAVAAVEEVSNVETHLAEVAVVEDPVAQKLGHVPGRGSFLVVRDQNTDVVLCLDLVLVADQVVGLVQYFGLDSAWSFSVSGPGRSSEQ